MRVIRVHKAHVGRQRLDGAAQDAREHFCHALRARQALLAPGQEPAHAAVALDLTALLHR